MRAVTIVAPLSKKSVAVVFDILHKVRYPVRFVYACCNTCSLSMTSELVVHRFQDELGTLSVDEESYKEMH